jgi:7-carboxy-7-deazaguanine synthase
LADLPQFDRDRILLMPQGTDRDELIARGEWLEPYCVEHGYRFCPRMQIEWFGARRGT